MERNILVDKSISDLGCGKSLKHLRTFKSTISNVIVNLGILEPVIQIFHVIGIIDGEFLLTDLGNNIVIKISAPDLVGIGIGFHRPVRQGHDAELSVLFRIVALAKHFLSEIDIIGVSQHIHFIFASQNDQNLVILLKCFIDQPKMRIVKRLHSRQKNTYFHIETPYLFFTFLF
jgi:hypothetical protein